MNIFIIIKCGFQDSFNFISQISKIQEVNKITVFRDTASINDSKVEYILPEFKKYTLFKLINRFFQILIKGKLKPEIIIGIYELPHGLLAVLAGKILRVPATVSIIGNPGYKKLRKGIRMIITKWILRNASFVTVTGSNSKQFLVSVGIPEEKIFILPNTIDFSLFTKKDDLKKEYDLISLGRISEEKRVEIIVRIIALLKTKVPDFKAAIAGIGPESDKIKALIMELNLEKNIEMLGYVPDEQLVTFFNSGRIFVLTSETEGFPRTIVQAAACGTPVVSSNVGDIADIIENNVNGFIVERCDNVEEYSEKILQLFNNEILYNIFSNKLMNKVHERFSHECATQVWNEILSKSRMV